MHIYLGPNESTSYVAPGYYVLLDPEMLNLPV